MSQTNNGNQESNLTEEQKIDSLLEKYESTIGLSPIPSDKNFPCIKYLYLSQEELSKMTSEQCSEACVLLNSFSFHLSRIINKEKTKLRWCNERILKSIANNLQEYRYFSPDERMALCIKDNDYAQKIKKLYNLIQARIDRIEYLPIRLEKVSESLVNLSFAKRKTNESR
jgi:hypothetical protein